MADESTLGLLFDISANPAAAIGALSSFQAEAATVLKQFEDQIKQLEAQVEKQKKAEKKNDADGKKPAPAKEQTKKSSTGTLILSGANAYTVATTINAGTLKEGAANVISDSSAVTVASGATYDLNSFSETIGSLAGGGTVTSGAAGAIIPRQ